MNDANPYRPLVGSWEAEATAHLPDGSNRRHHWQIRFDSVLEDRAIQDVWITPPRTGPHVGKSEPWGPFSNQYGTTIRVYDRKAFPAMLEIPKLWRGDPAVRGMHDWFATEVRMTFSRPVPLQIGGEALGSRQSVEFKKSPRSLDAIDWRMLGLD